ncbi:hypothetical protein [Noviherbaspirillum soli]|uniref:hypothetical protein n=1 Tax=Noviherbaspirillum soli TaxID=1064518 RepID=UPI00188ACA47|nr:hypothetical protein [Noviherbaspirillum soli]
MKSPILMEIGKTYYLVILTHIIAILRSAGLAHLAVEQTEHTYHFCIFNNS